MANEEKKPAAPQTKGAAVKRTDKKPGFFKRVAKWFREMRSELKKVVWPDAKTTAKNTGTVLLCSVAVGACIWIFDGVAMLLIKTLIGAFTG